MLALPADMLIQLCTFPGSLTRLQVGCYLWSPHPFSSRWRFHLRHGSRCRLTASSLLFPCSHRRPITCRLRSSAAAERPGLVWEVRQCSADTQLSLSFFVYLCSGRALHTSTKLRSSVSSVMWVCWKHKAVRLRGAPVLSSVFCLHLIF